MVKSPLFTWLVDELEGEGDCHALCRAAANFGHLDVLVWTRSQDALFFNWDCLTCVNAARGGHLQLLTWARANGCAWDRERTLAAAVARRHTEVQRWICEN
jgi:hypothetical protein